MSKVFVMICDDKLIEEVKSLYVNVRDKWDGDIAVMIPKKYEDSIPIELFEKKDLNVIIVPNLEGANHVDYYKIYLFSDYFSKWKWVLYSDLDVYYFNKIDLDLKNREHMFYAKKDRLKFIKQFRPNSNYSNVDLSFLDEMDNKDCFQACYMLIDTQKVKTHSIYNNLKKVYKKHHLEKKVTNEITIAQSLLNLVVDFQDLGDEFINIHPRFLQVSKKHWEDDFHDDTNYDETISVHFGRYFAPWQKRNLRFNTKWMEYKNKFKAN